MAVDRTFTHSDQTDGSTHVTTLENDSIKLTVDAQFGGRITTLVDKRTGRNWLVPDNGQEQDSESASFASQAWGWDECFPCLESRAQSDSSWQRPLRHHGDLWGRASEVKVISDVALETIWIRPEFSFSRLTKLSADTVHCTYRIVSTCSRNLPFLYSQHALLSVQPGETIDIRGPNDRLVSSIRVLSIETAVAEKLYFELAPGSIVTAGGCSGSLVYHFGRDSPAAVGIWLDFGGWPAGAGLHHVAIEPTTYPGHDAAAADSQTLHPGEELIWQVDVELCQA